AGRSLGVKIRYCYRRLTPMMIAVAVWALLNTPTQSLPRESSDAWYRKHLPVTLKFTQDVEVKPYSRPERRPLRTLVTGRDAQAFTIKKGETFQMTKLLGEGECR